MDAAAFDGVAEGNIDAVTELRTPRMTTMDGAADVVVVVALDKLLLDAEW